MNRQKLLVTSLLVFIVLLSFFIRVHKLGTDASFTTDEVTTVTNSMRSLSEILTLESRTPLQALWIRFGAMDLGLGYSEFAVYFLSVIVGVLAVFVVFFLGRSLFDHRVGLLSAFMLAFSAYHIYWSRSARYYSLMVLLSCAAFLFLYEALVTNSWKAWLGYALFRTLSLYDHLTAMWMFAGEVIFSLVYFFYPSFKSWWESSYRMRNLESITQLWREQKAELQRRSLKDWLTKSKLLWFALSVFLILLAYAPRWYPLLRDVYLGSSALRLGGVGTEQLSPNNIRSGQLRPVLGGGWLGSFIVLYLLDAWIAPLHILMMVAFVAGLLFCALRRQWTQLLFALTIMVTPFVLTATTKTYGIVLNGRYLISLLPLYYMMVGRGIVGFSQLIVNVFRLSDKRRAYDSIAIVVILGLVFAGLNFTRIPLTYRNTGPNWRVVGQFLAQHATPDQLIVVHGEPVFAKALQYYMPQHNVVEKDPLLSYDDLYQEQEDFWLVFLPGTDMYTSIRDWIDRNKGVSLVFTGAWYPDIDQNTALAPAQNWDLYVVYISREITSAEKALELHNTWLTEAESVNPSNVRRHLTLAEAYGRFNRCDLAVTEYAQALQEGYVNDQLASYIYDARGVCWDRLGISERAIADWQKAIERTNWSDEPYQHLGNIYMGLGKSQAALELYQKGIAANKKKAWPHVLLGDYYRRHGWYKLAISEYQTAVSIEPDDWIAYQSMAEMYAAAGEDTRVISLYKDAAQNNPWFGWPDLQLGQFYQSVGQITEAMEAYQRAVELQPELTPNVSGFLRDARWDLADVLNLVSAYSDQGALLWWHSNTWVKPYPFDQDVLIGRSTLTVEGEVKPNQLYIHPFSNDDNTYIEFEITSNPFAFIQVGYGLADDVMGQSNGVDYRIEIKRQDASDYALLFDWEVTQSKWQEQMISLASYWGEDIELRLVVGARGDYTYDWLQTTLQLAPPQYPVWDLATNLKEAKFLPDEPPLEWNNDGFYLPDGTRLVGHSELLVGGRELPGQVFLHPYSTEISSTLIFTLPPQPYRVLKTFFGLADEAVLRSNGVDYTVSISVDGEQSFTDLISTSVMDNTWRSEIVAVPPSKELILKLSASARQDMNFDWLQINLVLLPFDGDELEAQPLVGDSMVEDVPIILKRRH